MRERPQVSTRILALVAAARIAVGAAMLLARWLDMERPA
jgi:hypothetical protein